ncbi:MAG: 16S rRNA (cytosine(1402)-N(4))-methyltransferase RsmH [bacterium]
MHISVLKKQVLEYLNPQADENFIDGTIGGGGHALAILERTNGKLLGIDLEEHALEEIRKEGQPRGLEKRLILINDNFANLEKIVNDNNFGPVSGILLDLGVSSWHFDESGKGFSFRKDEFLDMRFGGKGEKTAADIVNSYSLSELENILAAYGEERFARRIAKRIVLARKDKAIVTSGELAMIVRQAVPLWQQRRKTDFATQTFQALRIAVNKELENLESVLPQALKILDKGGRLAVISFHSLEDRIVKRFFQEKQRQGVLKIITKKPVGPDAEEVRLNPRSRSAKLRVAIKI